MTKPVIVTRLGKGSELTFQEGDDNFTNLRDATVTVAGDTGSVTNELNGTMTISGGTGLTTSASGSTLTVNLDNSGVNAGSYTNANITVDNQGRITNAVNGFSGSYNDLTNKPTIPTNNNELTNGAGYITGINSGNVTTALGFTPENSANKNSANGYAGLDSNGKVASAQLPSYVDDVEEYANYAALPVTGESGKIYVTLDTNKTYRWGGSAYVEISPSPGTTDSLTEGSTNLYFTTQRARDSFSAGSNISITDGQIAVTGSLGLSNVVEDTTPQLGGNLDVNGNQIVSTANGNINLVASGSGNINITPTTGQIILGSVNFPTNTPSSGQVLTASNGFGQLAWSDPAGGGIASVSADTAPSLGGNLNVGSYYIDSVDSVVRIASSTVIFNKDSFTSGSTIIGSAKNQLRLQADAGGNFDGGAYITLNYGVNANAGIYSNGTGAVSLVAPNGNVNLSASNGKVSANRLNYSELIYDLGTTSGTITPNATNGNVQTITLNGNLTFSAFASPVAGQSITLIVKQDATGSRTLTSTMKWAGGTKTLSTAANAIDIISVFYDGTNYWASLSTDFK